MGYARIRLNLPRMSDYDPILPKVMKWNDLANEGKGAITGDVTTFVDDVRIVGFSKENCHLVHRQFTCRMQYLGFQDAPPQKYQPPSQSSAGAWTGTVFKVSSDTITKTVTMEKWETGISILSSLKKACDTDVDNCPILNRKQLDHKTGFLNHLSMTYDTITPFLKGFYLTLNSWQPCRDDEDWKMSKRAWDNCHSVPLVPDNSEEDTPTNAESEDAPLSVKASPRFTDDVRALLTTLQGDSPPVVQLRAKSIVSVVFGFGNASGGTGSGSTFTCGTRFSFRIGVWGSLEKDKSSNWKEFSNVVESLEEEAELGNLKHAEVFFMHVHRQRYR